VVNLKKLKYDKKFTPLVNSEALEALISGWNAPMSRNVDVYFPLRIWFLKLTIKTRTRPCCDRPGRNFSAKKGRSPFSERPFEFWW